MNKQYWKLRQWEATRLCGLSPYAQIMYTLGFAAGCDGDTGIFSKTMSRQSWWEVLSAVPQRGSNKDWNKVCGLPNLYEKPEAFKSFIRARLVELERASLIEKIESQKYFLCVYSISDPSDRGGLHE